MAAHRKINIRAVAAVAGTGAVLTLGWLSIGAGDHGTSLALHSPPPPPAVSSEVMTLGATTTTEQPAQAANGQVEPMKAQPTITGPVALPSEEAGLP